MIYASSLLRCEDLVLSPQLSCYTATLRAPKVLSPAALSPTALLRPRSIPGMRRYATLKTRPEMEAMARTVTRW